MAQDDGQSGRSTLDRAMVHVQRIVSKESTDADLYFRLKYDPSNPDKVTISGLSGEDYRSLDDLEVAEFGQSHLRAFPRELRDLLNNAQSFYTMGVLPEIARAYMTVDGDLYMWNYEDSCDLACFDGIPNTITKVAVAKPKLRVFEVIYATTICYTKTFSSLSIRSPAPACTELSVLSLFDRCSCTFPTALLLIHLHDFISSVY
ncbi:unnamed protein product [Gongylonema pulchrum]|uniref:Nucleoporin_N domain-containing protein n=1 Tax=Gongylonema pulchrum TaxID=637853 RepID=A0A183E2Y5_9BILA|nr:unnamed protein product [Gongylonema pulchrum]